MFFHNQTPFKLRDGIHGIIRHTKVERDVLDHPLFQRLRNIHQLGAANLAFPSANHKRFEHSLGVMQIYTNLLERMATTAHSNENKLHEPPGEEGEAIRFHELEAGIRAYLWRVGRLGALMHDIGHGAYSHAFDPFQPTPAEVQKLLEGPDEYLHILHPFKEQLCKAGKNGRVSHEVISCLFMTKILSDIGIAQAEPDVVLTLAAVYLQIPADELLQLGDKIKRPQWVPFIRMLLSSAPIDADRMDYLLRDGKGTGVSVGAYDTERIYDSSLCVKTQEGYALGWRLSGLSAIKHFLSARARMFEDVYYYKVDRVVKAMFEEMGRELVNCKGSILDTQSMDTLQASYTTLTDDVFLQVIEGTVCLKHNPNFQPSARMQELAHRVRTRKLWKRLYHFNSKETDRIELLKAEATKKFPTARFEISRSDVKPVKELENGAHLIELNAMRRYHINPTQILDWKEFTPEIANLDKSFPPVVHLLFKDEGKPGEPAFKDVRDWAYQYMNSLKQVSTTEDHACAPTSLTESM